MIKMPRIPKHKTLVSLDPALVELDDPEPEGYLEWHDWVQMQARKGRKQVRHDCGRYWWPHTRLCKHCKKGAKAHLVV